MRHDAALDAWLAQRLAQAAALRRQVEQLARQDTRIVAAWWFGSYARAATDALSDLDIWLVVDDGQLDMLVEQRAAYVARLGEPVLTLEAWGNAPDPGATTSPSRLPFSGRWSRSPPSISPAAPHPPKHY